MDGINFALVRCSLSIMNCMKKYNEGIVGGDFMIRLAACDDERIFLDKTKKFINQYNRSQPDTRNLDCITYSSPRFLLDCVLAGEIFDIFLLDLHNCKKPPSISLYSIFLSFSKASLAYFFSTSLH